MRQVSYSQGYARNKWECAPEWAWFWDGLVGLWVPALGPTGNTLWNVSGNFKVGSATVGASQWVQRGLRYNASGNASAPVYNMAHFTSLVYCIMHAFPLSGYVSLSGFRQGTSGTRDKTLHVGTTGDPYCYAWDGGAVYTSTPTSNISLENPVTVAGTANGTQLSCYLNGVLVGSSVCSNTYTGYSSPSFNMGGGDGTFGDANVTIISHYLYPYALDPGAIAQLSRDPLGPLRLPRRRLWSVSGPIDYPVSFSVDRVLSTVPAGMGAAVPTLTLSRIQNISEEGIANAVGSLSSGIILALTESGLVQAGDSTILSTVRAITPVGVAGAVDGLTASTVRTVGTDGAAAVQDATALAQIRAFTTEGAVAAADQVVLAIIKAITTGGIVSASDGMTLGEVVTIATTSIAAANPTLTVTRLLSVTSNGIAVVTGLAALSQTKSITADGMAIVGPGFGLPGYVSLITTFASTRAIMVLPTVIVPGALVDPERVYEVAVSLREYLLEEVQRSREVTKEERSEIVDIQVDVWW